MSTNHTGSHGGHGGHSGHSGHSEHAGHVNSIHLAKALYWSEEVRIAISVIIGVVALVICVASASQQRRMWTNERRLSGRSKRRFERFRRDLGLFTLVSFLGLVPVIFNACIPEDQLCGITRVIIQPYMALAKYMLYRVFFAKAAIFDVFNDYPLLFSICRISVCYLAVPVLLAWVISNLMLFKGEMIPIPGWTEMCVGVCNLGEHVTSHIGVTLALTTSFDLALLSLPCALLLIPTYKCKSQHAKNIALQNTVGAGFILVTSFLISIFFAVADIKAGYVLFRVTDDYLILDWFKNLVVVTITFGALGKMLSCFYSHELKTESSKSNGVTPRKVHKAKESMIMKQSVSGADFKSVRGNSRISKTPSDFGESKNGGLSIKHGTAAAAMSFINSEVSESKEGGLSMKNTTFGYVREPFDRTNISSPIHENIEGTAV